VADKNLYKPPAAPVRDTGPSPPHSLLLAVLAGLAVDIVGTIVSRVALLVAFVGAFDADRILAAQSRPLSLIFISLVTLGCVFSALGGYICARMARRHELRTTALLAALRAAIALPMFATNAAWVSVVVLPLTFASVMAGGEIGRRRNSAQAREPDVATVV